MNCLILVGIGEDIVGLPKIFFIGTVVVFAVVGAGAFFKKQVIDKKKIAAMPCVEKVAEPAIASPLENEALPDADRVKQLFALDSSKLPIVETISFTSRVPWLTDRPAWISDYASYYGTSRHFIARSLNHKPDYFTQKVFPGDRFNVFRRDKNIEFYLLVDLSRCKMWFYYFDQDTNERVLLKTYRIGIGRVDSQKSSGYLTPVGKYSLGNKIAIYKPGTVDIFQERPTEMIRVFGTRWIPFEKEVDGCSEGAKGFGIHGAPWIADPATGQPVEDRSTVGRCDSDGCIRLYSEDIEELFSIVVSRPTQIELTNDFHQAHLPGEEVDHQP